MIYKPSSLLRLHIADTSALPMLELGLMPVVTTMTLPALRIYSLARPAPPRKKILLPSPALKQKRLPCASLHSHPQ